MLYKKNTLGRTYTRLVTGSSNIFIGFVLLGVISFLFLTLTIRIDVIKTYTAKVLSSESEIVLQIKAANVQDGPAYIYSNKNEAVFPVSIEKTEDLNDSVNLYFSSDSEKVIRSLSPQHLYVEIPQGKETLLYRIFLKGGKGRE